MEMIMCFYLTLKQITKKSINNQSNMSDFHIGMNKRDDFII